MKRLARLLPRLEGDLHHILLWAGDGWRLPWLCLALALLGTLFAAYPITSVVIPAVLVAPARWRAIAFAAAVGSAVGALILVLFLHHMGWGSLYAYFPQLLQDANWQRVMAWTQDYGLLTLLLVSISPLPQTPALIVLSSVPHGYLGVLMAIFIGKLLKYMLFAWVGSRFPGRLQAFLHRHGRHAGRGDSA
ncbi:hypothetical protein ACNFBT_02530 [Pseudomonas sp. NY15181]|uniref:hypothetical protein n=1 Tax=Pseudomonas sp. NY15181 TaxID=3400349 RepID=UPI003A884608